MIQRLASHRPAAPVSLAALDDVLRAATHDRLSVTVRASEAPDLTAIVEKVKADGIRIGLIELGIADDATGLTVPPTELLDANVISVTATNAVDFSDSTAVDWIAWLRNAAAAGLAVHWYARDVPDDFAALLVHLAPPLDVNPVAMRWQERHRFGLCTWRRGPGFLLVADDRDAEAPARHRIDSDEHLAAFHLLADPTDQSAIPADLLGAVGDLTDASLVVEHAGRFLALPYRPARWPVPCPD